jgi:hypothetical protein
LPSTVAGPVHPFGVASTIIGQRGLNARRLLRAVSWITRMSSITRSSISAMSACIVRGSAPSTKNGRQPYPRSSCFSSSREILASTVGFAILYPFKWRIGMTAPSLIGFRNLFECHAVASGPVSASPSPMTHAAIREGLSSTAPKAWLSE